MRTARRTAAGLAVAAALAVVAGAPVAAAAQVQWRPTVLAALAEHRVTIGGGADQASGFLVGLGVEAVVHPVVTVDARATGGRLGADAPPAEDRDVGELALGAAIFPLPSLGLVLGARARRYEGTLGSQRWLVITLGPEGRVALYGDAVQGRIRLTVAPFTSVTGLPAPDRALGGHVEITYARDRLDAMLGYSLERFDFSPANAGRRHEQLAALTLRFGWRLGR
ncbi:MAG TPA: hypothetical protein VNA89_02705 [Gemmatimonadaceae bacterium]|nr:hypothetical protein [Gemmatimonadaceae bacterium]